MKRLYASLASLYQFDQALQAQYSVIHRLGKGAEGSVWLARDRASRSFVAVKLVKRGLGELQSMLLYREIELQAQLDHPNLVKLREVLLTPQYLGLVFDYSPGGTLASYLNRKPRSEAEAKFLIWQLLRAVEYCHRHRVAHRDLKPENILIDEQRPPTIKLADFGVAVAWKKQKMRRTNTVTGTPGYICPEILDRLFLNTDRAYDATKSDMWSCGVLMAQLLLGTNPYRSESRSNLDAREELESQWLATDRPWRESHAVGAAAHRLSPTARDLLDQMLCRDEDGRLSATAALQHPWFTDGDMPAKLHARMVAMQHTEGHTALCKGDQSSGSKLSAVLDAAADRSAPVIGCVRVLVDQLQFDTLLSSRASSDTTEVPPDPAACGMGSKRSSLQSIARSESGELHLPLEVCVSAQA